MNRLNNINKINRNTQEYFSRFRIPSGCAVFGVVNESGERFSGQMVMDGISVMHERSNGLGGGFAAYGIYPGFEDDWVFHVFYDDMETKRQTEDEIARNFKILFGEEIPTVKISQIVNPPVIYRYFLKSKRNGDAFETEEDSIMDFVMHVNRDIRGAYIVSSGKNMGIFKGVGFPEDIGRFFKLDQYKGHLWTSHGRFPTNSVGWWGGAHPFGLLNWSVVHNGEISSFGTNKRFVSRFGYECTLSTDTEVITYLLDLLVRKQKIDIELVHLILASPLWEDIERMPVKERDILKALRILYGSALLNGPFSIIAGSSDFMYALNDRIKLRPLVAARKDRYLFISSEEAPIRRICASPDHLWHPDGGEPVIGIVRKKEIKKEIKSVRKIQDNKKFTKLVNTEMISLNKSRGDLNGSGIKAI
ncbi:MAG: glutamine amidotransferase family protein [Actinomycetota bacterium]|nr:glutamine amidotransferase family protein [Actinomycetota bacterium]